MKPHYNKKMNSWTWYPATANGISEHTVPDFIYSNIKYNDFSLSAYHSGKSFHTRQAAIEAIDDAIIRHFHTIYSSLEYLTNNQLTNLNHKLAQILINRLK